MIIILITIIIIIIDSNDTKSVDEIKNGDWNQNENQKGEHKDENNGDGRSCNHSGFR